jgi:hypothetical protein
LRLLDRLARWWLRRRQSTGHRTNSADLREFVYLDEVSVYSLISSQIGSVAEQYTTKQMDTMSSELSSSMGVVVPTVANAAVGSKLSASNTSERQVLRKSTIQGTYRELREAILQKRLLLPLRGITLNEVGSANSPSDLMREYVRAGVALDEGALVRGGAIELSVRLEPDDTFSAMTLIDTLRLFEKFADTRDPAVKEGFQTATSLGEILRSMLTGLVPLRGFSLDYSLVAHEGQRWIVQNEAVEQSGIKVRATPLIVTTVADQTLFWKDVRRLLFGGSSYTVMGRISSNGLVDSWSPVKLNNVLRRYVPDIADQLDSLGPLIGTLNLDSQRGQAPPGREQLRMALTRFAASLGESSPVPAPDNLDQSIDVAVETVMVNPLTPDEWRPAFADLMRRLPVEWAESLDPNAAAVLRQECIDQAAATNSAAILPVTTHRPPAAVLDVELIAVHW